VKFVSRQVAKAQSLKGNKVSLPRHSAWRASLVSSVAKWFGPVCGGVFAANLAQFATKSATARRDKYRSTLWRKSTILLLLSGRVSLSSGRDADGRRPTSQVATACHRVVAQARGCSAARVSQKSQRT